MLVMDYNGEKFKREIMETLRANPEGLTIQDLAKKTGAHRQTVTKYVLWLEGAGVIIRRRVGAATLHYLKSRFVEAVKEKDILDKLKKKLG